MSGYRTPAFLSADDEPTHRVRCPIHGFIRFSENERRVIDHRLFQRLRYIRQLALTELIYPGATHTRFEHSLGVMEIATRAFDSLARAHGSQLEYAFKTVPALEREPMAKARQFLRLAALLHDVGHASFSHAAESVVHENAGHEILSVLVVRNEELLGGLIRRYFGDECSEYVARIIEGGRDLPPQLQVLHDLVSGEMDADRTDYLLRDSHHCGVEYGRFDYRRMIECLEITVGEAGSLDVALHRDGIHTFEALILARYQMSTQVYYHRLRCIYDIYLAKYHRALADEEPFSTESILANNDMTMMARILADARDGKGDRRKWAERIANRRHHRVVHDTGANAKALDVRNAKALLPWLQEHHGGCEYLVDTAEIKIHKLLTPDDQEEEGLVRLPLVGMDDRRRFVGFESQVLSKIPRKSYCVRVFADLSREQRTELLGIRQAICDKPGY